LNILVVASDPKLAPEVQAALKGFAAGQDAVVHVAGDYRQGSEIARNRRPQLVLVEMTADLATLKTLAEEISVGSPESAVAAVFHPNIFGPDVSESAIIIEAIRAGIRDFLRRPLSTSDLEQFLARLGRKIRVVAAATGKVISFISNKGGVGKSTMAVNVAAGLAKRHPRRVLLIDASLQLGVCASMLDLQPATTLTDAVRQRQRLDETLVKQLAVEHPCGLDLLAAPKDAVEANEVDDESMARILTLSRRAYDFVIVDSFPLIDRVMMAVLDMSDAIYVVLESVVPTVLGAAKLCQLLDNLNIPQSKQRIVINRYANFAGNLSPSDVATRIGRPIDYLVPYDKNLLISANTGQPLIFRAGRWFSTFGKVTHRMIDDLEAVPADAATRNGKIHP